MDTAGLKWPPDMGPTAYTIVNTVRPKASETPNSPIPTAGNVAASTALPHPPSTSQKVPRNSAKSFFEVDICIVLNVRILIVGRHGLTDINGAD
jgi:hypothetical protein